MLVLSRKKGESIMIGDDVEITIAGTHGSSIQVGISAPRRVTVLRKEVYKAVERENHSARQMTSMVHTGRRRTNETLL